MTYYMISLVITSNDILLNLSIALIYLLIFHGFLIQYTSLSFYYNFNSYSLKSHLLGLNPFYLNYLTEPYN